MNSDNVDLLFLSTGTIGRWFFRAARILALSPEVLFVSILSKYGWVNGCCSGSWGGEGNFMFTSFLLLQLSLLIFLILSLLLFTLL
jgi:hypothetical protein